MTDTPRTDEVADYEAAVRRHLADLPPAVREDLLADLETHLAEVAADLEPGATLAERLGPPESYAAELREAAELDAVQGGSPRRARLTAAIGRAAESAGGVADRITGSAGAGTFAEFRTALKPAWWILRGVAAAVLLIYLWFRSDEGLARNSIGTPWFTLLLCALIAAGFAWVSLRLGAASVNWRRGPQRVLALGGLLVVCMAAARFVEVFFSGPIIYYTDGGSDYGQYDHTEDVYPYNEDGELLTDVYLLDQYGEPLYIGDPSQCPVVSENLFEEEAAGGDLYGPQDDYGYQYPLCVAGDEDALSPTAEPTGTALPEDPTADETPTADEPTTTEGPTAE